MLIGAALSEQPVNLGALVDGDLCSRLRSIGNDPCWGESMVVDGNKNGGVAALTRKVSRLC